MKPATHIVRAMALALALAGSCATSCEPEVSLTIPRVVIQGTQRAVTVDDISRVRTVLNLVVSPNRDRFAVLIRQGDPDANSYRSGWFVGTSGDGELRWIGDGGELDFDFYPSGHLTESVSRAAQWSPDGRWIAYARYVSGALQIWLSSADGRARRQLTRNERDILQFAWSMDSREIRFTTGPTRSALSRHENELRRSGFQYDRDLFTFSDFMAPSLKRPVFTADQTWVVSIGTMREWIASAEQIQAFTEALNSVAAGYDLGAGFLTNAVVAPIHRRDGAAAWLDRGTNASRMLQVVARLNTGAQVLPCNAAPCRGVIERIWWNEKTSELHFLRREGVNERSTAVYSWNPGAAVVQRQFLSNNDLSMCAPLADNQVICVRETPSSPPKLISVNLRAGDWRVISELNPEFRNIRLCLVERLEWDTPKFAWNRPGQPLAGLYPERAHGYVIFPPDFDPRRRYPVFIDPYVAGGFRPLGAEHALQVYAAIGIIVLRTEFPVATDMSAALGSDPMSVLYSPELDFPHLTMLMESTLAGLDALIARGFIDTSRIGIGGVSQGTFVPLYMLQNYDRIAAISISSTTWGPHEYYWATNRGLEAVADVVPATRGQTQVIWPPDPKTPKGAAAWDAIDIASHVEQVEAPILMNLPATETYGLLRFIRHLGNARRPYDAYVFERETHLKWQPAHLDAIMRRNVDWFRFWLQDIEDADPGKTEQYIRWRHLRDLQCRNGRSLRNYCRGEGTQAPITQ